MKLLYKHAGKVLAVVMVAVAVFVWLLPTMLSYGPLRSAILRGVLDDRVVVRIESLRLGWFQSTIVGGLEVEDGEQRYQIQVPQITNDVPFWRLIVNPRKLGNLTVERAEAHLHLRDLDEHLLDFRDRTDSPLDRDKLTAALDRSVSVKIVDASLFIHNKSSENSWTIADINLTGELVPASDHKSGAVLKIPRAQLLNEMELTQGMSDDLLKFAAPILHRVANTSGRVSLRVGEIEIPLADHRHAQGRGTLQIHEGRLHSGPLAERIVALLGLPETVEVVTDSTVDFEVADGRVYHEGLDFGIGNFRVRTRGYVGFDESLDLICEIPIPLDSANLEDRPILAALRGKTLEIPIVGTLDRPEIDTTQIGKSVRDLARSALRDLAGRPGEAGELFDAEGELNLPEALSTVEGVLRELDLGEGQLLERIRQGRMERQRPPGAEDQTPPRGRILDRLRQRRAPQPDEPPPPEVPEGAIDL